MEFKDCLEDFISNFSYSFQGKVYNKLIGVTTRITSSATLLFADGELLGPIEMNDNGKIIRKPELIKIASTKTENPSAYLEEHQDLANSVKHILISPL
jgi:hypothetical protein